MKKLFTIIILIALGCSEDELKPITDLTGTWKFTGTNVSGEFKIINVGGKPSVATGGKFVIEGETYISDRPTYNLVVIDNVDILDITFSTVSEYLEFREITYTPDFLKITSEHHEFGIFCQTTSCKQESDEIVLITRK
jgi:hypothetical protein